MKYKYDWDFRIQTEEDKYLNFSEYKIVTSDSSRFKNYTEEEIEHIINLKKKGVSDKEISKALNRSYWSIVYKLKELRKDGHL